MLEQAKFQELPEPQRDGIRAVYQRWFQETQLPHNVRSFNQFLSERVSYSGLMGCAMVECPTFSGTIWLGIEPDGYTHS